MRYFVKTTLVALFAVVSLGVSFAQDELDVAELESAFLQTLPFGWTLVKFNVEVQENYGTSVEPDIRTRFNAVVELTIDTFVQVEQDDTVTLLRPVAEAGERRIFFGIATSRRSQDAWQTTFEFENNPTEELGNPRGFFSGQLIVLGSEEEAQYRARLEGEAQAVQETDVSASATAQEFEYTTTFISMSGREINFPTVAFRDESCTGQATEFLTERDIREVQTFYDQADPDWRAFFVLNQFCLVFLDVDRSEANTIIASIVGDMREGEIKSLGQGYFGISYAYLTLVQSPDIMNTHFMIAEEHGPEETIRPYNFGFFVFEYLPNSSSLRLHSYWYTFSPGK